MYLYVFRMHDDDDDDEDGAINKNGLERSLNL